MSGSQQLLGPDKKAVGQVKRPDAGPRPIPYTRARDVHYTGGKGSRLLLIYYSQETRKVAFLATTSMVVSFLF
jgi:hypothetical protein